MLAHIPLVVLLLGGGRAFFPFEISRACACSIMAVIEITETSNMIGL